MFAPVGAKECFSSRESLRYEIEIIANPVKISPSETITGAHSETVA